MSNKASQLGAGRFGSTTRPVSARRAAAAAVAGVPTDGVAPPTELPIDRVSLNPDNPRGVYGDLTDLVGSLREHGQKQAITVMNRDAYAAANPDQASALGPEVTHVVVDGSSRLVAAREAGLTQVKVMVDDSQGEDAEAILESALVANIHRQNLSELDEARALERLLTIHLSQRALARRLHRSQGWVSQRLALLGLTPEMREKVGVEPIEILREVGKAPSGEQAALLERLRWERSEARRPSVPEVPAVAPGGAERSVPPSAESSVERAPERGGRISGGAGSVPEPRPTRLEEGARPEADAGEVPWHDPEAVVRLAQRRMTAEGFARAAGLMAVRAGAVAEVGE